MLFLGISYKIIFDLILVIGQKFKVVDNLSTICIPK